jgi:Insertion element 4 transposase N-terminal
VEGAKATRWHLPHPRAASPPPITDRIALGALTSTFPPELVDRVVAATGRAEQRRRLLPARVVVVYFVLALALYSHAAYEEVMRCLVEGLGWAVRARQGRRSWPYWHVPGASALGEARERLGAEPLKVLFAQAARPLATVATRGGWYRRWRVLVLDGTCLDVPDTPENAAAFGRPGSGRGEGKGAFPQVRVGGWWRRARTRSSAPPRVPTAAGSRPWPAGWPAGAGR